MELNSLYLDGLSYLIKQQEYLVALDLHLLSYSEKNFRVQEKDAIVYWLQIWKLRDSF